MTKRYNSERWKEVRNAALARDRVCQDCGSAEHLHVHHIAAVRQFDAPEDAHFLDNLVVLCQTCHPDWEGKKTRPNLLDRRSGLQMSRLVHDLSKETVGRLADPAGPFALYKYFIENYFDSRSVCDHCFTTLGGTRRSVECCHNCGRPPSLWDYYHTPPETTGVVEIVSRASERLRQIGIPFDEATSENAACLLWESEDHYGKIKAVTRASIRLGIREAWREDAVEFVYDPICPLPTPTP